MPKYPDPMLPRAEGNQTPECVQKMADSLGGVVLAPDKVFIAMDGGYSPDHTPTILGLIQHGTLGNAMPVYTPDGLLLLVAAFQPGGADDCPPILVHLSTVTDWCLSSVGGHAKGVSRHAKVMDSMELGVRRFQSRPQMK